MTRAISLVVLLASAACNGHPAPSPAPPSSSAAEASSATDAAIGASSFEGTIRVPDEEPPGKRKLFRGAWIERDGGERWVIDYAPDSPYRALRDRRVRVEGEIYEPKDQALVAKHFRVRSMLVVGKDATDAPLVRVGEQRHLLGLFSEITYPPRTKLAGEKETVFVDAGGANYHLAHMPEGRPALGARAAVEAYEVEPSPFVARVGGRYLWVLEVHADAH